MSGDDVDVEGPSTSGEVEPVADAVALVSDTSDAAANNCVMILTVASLVIAGDAVILVVERSEGVTE